MNPEKKGSWKILFALWKVTASEDHAAHMRMEPKAKCVTRVAKYSNENEDHQLCRGESHKKKVK